MTHFLGVVDLQISIFILIFPFNPSFWSIKQSHDTGPCHGSQRPMSMHHGTTFWQIVSISFVLTQFLTFLPLECLGLFPKHLINSLIFFIYWNLWMSCCANIEWVLRPHFDKISHSVTVWVIFQIQSPMAEIKSINNTITNWEVKNQTKISVALQWCNVSSSNFTCEQSKSLKCHSNFCNSQSQQTFPSEGCW